MNNLLHKNDVVVWQTGNFGYPKLAPYNPGPNNEVYEALKNSLLALGLDKENFGTESWNPLGVLIVPGNTVVIKPNAVNDVNIKNRGSVFASITHGSVMRVAIDFVYKALKGKGRIVIADAPGAICNFDNWKKLVGINEIVELYKKEKNFNLEVYDLRQMHSPWNEKHGYAPAKLKARAQRDPAGYKEIDLEDTSMFADLTDEQCKLMFGADYNREHTIKVHTKGHHKYKVSQTFLDADVVISITKLKTHMKVGTTLNIKSMVGTQGDKNYIPHCRIGDPSRGGDEYPDLGILQNALNRYRMWVMSNILSKEKPWADFLYKNFFRVIQNKLQGLLHRYGKYKKGDKYMGNVTGGSWWGNDTAWRMALDLIKIILYADRNGIIQKTPQRKFFSIIDGVIAGHEDGPLYPTDKLAYVLITGFNPLAVDLAATVLMGFDPNKIKILSEGQKLPWLALWKDELNIHSNNPKWSDMNSVRNNDLGFTPNRSWKGHIEKTNV
jgi:uncharacterized protein (DUF362 family)